MNKRFKPVLKFIQKRWILIVTAVIALSIIGSIQYRNSTKISYKNSYKVRRQNLKETVSFSGKIDAEEKATLRFQTSGKLAWVGVKEGDQVKPYQAIASLDQAQLKKELQKDLNTYVKTRLGFDQGELNIQPGIIGSLNQNQQDRLLNAAKQEQYTLDNSVLDVELSSISLQLANIYSPIKGVVTRGDVKVAGVNVTPAQAEFDIVNPDTIFFSATVDQTDVVHIDEGMSGDIALDAFPDKEIQGTITSVSYAPDANETGTVYTVKMALGNRTSDSVKLRLGMTGDSTFTLKERDDVVAVPTTYIKHEGGKAYVMKKVNNKPVKTYVNTGEEIDIATIITSGLESGDVVYD